MAITSKKKERALSLIETAVNQQNNCPVLFASFGKDSLVLLSLIQEACINIPIGYFELGIHSNKHDFARNIIAKSATQTQILIPSRTVAIRGKRGTDLGYEIALKSGDKVTIVGATLEEDGLSNISCCLTNGLIKGESNNVYPWDTILCGRKRTDSDPTVGSLNLSNHVAELSHGGKIIMPLLEWSDEDVTEYLINVGAPIDYARYRISDRQRLVEKADKKFSPDHVYSCTRCVTTSINSNVFCPLKGHIIPAIFGVEEVPYHTDEGVSPAFMF